MRFDTSQHMRMGQQMKLAPRMIQSMEILQMALPQLEERIEQELENNIALEIAEPDPNELTQQAASTDPTPTSDTEAGANDGSDFERLSDLEENYAESLDNAYESADRRTTTTDSYEPPPRAARLDGEPDAKSQAIANTAGSVASLTDQLLEQWSFTDVAPELRDPGVLIIEHIEEDGYIRTPLPDILKSLGQRHNNITLESLERALTACQLFLEPPGIAARNTCECLLLQLDALLDEKPVQDLRHARELVADHLDDLTQNRIPKIVQRTGWSLDEVQAAIAAMKGLRLHPGRDLVSDTEPPVTPDAIVEWNEDAQDYAVYLSDARLPNLQVNREYAEMARDAALDKRDRDFIKTNLGNAHWLIDAVEQRKRTLLRVVRAVVAAQRAVFDEGPEALAPLPMTQIADQLGIHVATVSRAVAGKWLITPRGSMPLRMFFIGGTQTAEGEDVSWERIKAAMRDIIDNEDKQKPLSDEAISKALSDKGFDIARRTVAKYRGQLDIPSARMRKQFT